MKKKISVFYTASARKDLNKLSENDAKRVVLKIKSLTTTDPLLKAKSLSGIFQGLYRYRIGDFRAVFNFDDKGMLYILTILKIKHRKDIYK